MDSFIWIVVYIAVLAAISLTVRWLLLRSARRRHSETDKHPSRKKSEGEDND